MMNEFQQSIYDKLEEFSTSGIDVPIEALISAYHLDDDDEFQGFTVDEIARILLEEGIELSKQNLSA